MVTTSDGRWQEATMPTDVIGLVNQLGLDGWEMVNSSGPSNDPTVRVTPWLSFQAVFKRPLP